MRPKREFRITRKEFGPRCRYRIEWRTRWRPWWRQYETGGYWSSCHIYAVYAEAQAALYDIELQYAYHDAVWQPLTEIAEKVRGILFREDKP